MSAAAKTRDKRDKARKGKRGSANRMAVVDGTKNGKPAIDAGSLWLQQHHIVRAADTIRAGLKGYAVLDQRAHDALWAQHKITVRQWRAADHLLKKYHQARIESASTGAYEGGSGGGKGRKHGARPRDAVPNSGPLKAYTDALRSLGVVDAKVVRALVIDNKPPTQARDAGGRHGNAVVVVKDALDLLADYWHRHGDDRYHRSVPGMEPGADDGAGL